MHVCVCSQASRSRATLTLGVFFAFLPFAESFVVEQQTLFGVDLIYISMISDVKVQCQGRGVGSGLRFKSRIFRICLYLRKDTSRGYTCLSGHFF